MGREVRMVPKNWEHPKDQDGNYIPMHDGSYEDAAKNWGDGYEEWKKSPESNCRYWEYSGMPPESEGYMFKETPNDLSYFCMYEDTSEGTPMSPPMKTQEELAKYLADNNVSSFAGMTSDYDQWLAMIKQGSCCSMVISGGKMYPGVEAVN